VRLVAADTGDVAALLAAFGINEVTRREKRSERRRGAEDDVAGADVLLQQTLILRVRGRQDCLLRARVVFFAERVDVRRVIGQGVVESHDAVAGGVEGPSDNVEVMDFVAAE
jgi:hypothetical protein